MRMEGVVHLLKVRTIRLGGKPYPEAQRSRGSTPAAGPSTVAPGSLSGLGPRTGPPTPSPAGRSGGFCVPLRGPDPSQSYLFQEENVFFLNKRI